jgi:hypothetical protein
MGQSRQEQFAQNERGIETEEANLSSAAAPERFQPGPIARTGSIVPAVASLQGRAFI